MAERSVDGFWVADGGDLGDDRFLAEAQPDAGWGGGAGVEEPGVEVRVGREAKGLG